MRYTLGIKEKKKGNKTKKRGTRASHFSFRNVLRRYTACSRFISFCEISKRFAFAFLFFCVPKLIIFHRKNNILKTRNFYGRLSHDVLEL